MRMERWWRVCAFSVLTAWMLSGCDQPGNEVVATPVQVAVMTLTAADVNLTDELPGRVTAVRTAEIRAQVGGIVQRRLFEQGAEISAGQALFQINPAPFKADVDMAAAALQRSEAVMARARLQESRLKPLVQAEAISRQVYDDAASQRDQAAADVAQARATLARRQLDLNFSQVDAPISGRIDQAQVTEGALVGPTDTNPMARIQQIDQVYVDVRQPATSLEVLRDLLAVKKLDVAENADSLPATIIGSSGRPYPQTGRILFSGINVDAGTGDVLLRIQVDNPQRLLLPGMFVRARVPSGYFSNALMVPQQAVVRQGNRAQIWVIDKQNKAHAIPVELGELTDRKYVIRMGLSEGDRVVVEGLERLSENIKVVPHPWKSLETAAAPTL
ncbi:TPA: efflux RND transporter periplasmic adaptor subunit [Yersinia enterocolitica]